MLILIASATIYILDFARNNECFDFNMMCVFNFLIVLLFFVVFDVYTISSQKTNNNKFILFKFKVYNYII